MTKYSIIFFQPAWSEAKIIQEIEYAYGNKTKDDNNPAYNKYTGLSHEGIPIQMALRPNALNGSIITAYPKYP